MDKTQAFRIEIENALRDVKYLTKYLELPINSWQVKERTEYINSLLCKISNKEEFMDILDALYVGIDGGHHGIPDQTGNNIED